MASAPIDGRGFTVDGLFGGRRYQLDYHQREYTWGSGNVRRLVEDLRQRFSAEWNALHDRKEASRCCAGFRARSSRLLVAPAGQAVLGRLAGHAGHTSHCGRGVDTAVRGFCRSLIPDCALLSLIRYDLITANRANFVPNRG